MERDKLARVIESLLYMADHPLTVKEIQSVIDLKTITKEVVEATVETIKQEYEARNSSIAVVGVAGGYQMATKPEMSQWVRKLYKERLTVRLSASALETLSIIAYKQPITRSEIEQIRGVEATGVMDTLLERRLVRVVGKKETIGRPLLFGTTSDFLRQFGLKHLSDLPDLATITLKATELSAEEKVEQTELPMDSEEQSEPHTEVEAESEADAEVESSDKELVAVGAELEESSVASEAEPDAVPEAPVAPSSSTETESSEAEPIEKDPS